MGQRRDGREAAVQYLFAHELHEPAGSKSDAEREAFWEIHTAKPRARKFAEELSTGVLNELPLIDNILGRYCVNFTIDRLANVDRNIMRLAIYELMHARALPAIVIISEAVEIAKKFGAPESTRFVNGVLDRVARELRPKGLRHKEEPEPSEESAQEDSHEEESHEDDAGEVVFDSSTDDPIEH